MNSNQNIFKIGLIINPIAGMGGSVGLKGTDGRDTLQKAIKLGADPNAQNRTKEFLTELKSVKHKLQFFTCPKDMGENVLKELGFEYTLLSHPIFEDIESVYDSTPGHTKTAARLLKVMEDIEIIIFVGGDGTARDIQNVIRKAKPCLGIPAGVKIYSSVFSIDPQRAANLLLQFLWDETPLKESDVLDIDEEAFRNGRLVSQLYGYLLTPFSLDYSQPSKMASPDSDLNNQERIARNVVEDLEEDIYYLIGPGTTTKAITDQLNQSKSVLGVDLLRNKEVIAFDLNEQEILDYINDHPTKIIVSPIGKQGFLFGRGNLQLSPQVIKTVGIENIIIVCTKYKLNNIPDTTLKLDTRDSELDEKMRGLYRVVTDYGELTIVQVK